MIRWLSHLAVLGLALASSVFAFRAEAMCDVIPGVKLDFRGALGSVNRPYAIPGDNGEQIEITLDPSTCSGASPGFGSEDDLFVTILFKPPGSGASNAIVLTTAVNLTTCQSRVAAALPALGGSASCRTVTAGTPELTVLDPNRLSFRFPDTDAEFSDPGDPATLTDDLTFTGPAVLAVSLVADPLLPFDLSTKRCAERPGLLSCIDELYENDSTCWTSPDHLDPVFGHFTALPPANDYQSICNTPGVCDNSSVALRFTVDTAGNALVPMNYRDVLLRPDDLPVPRLVTGDTTFPAFGGGGPLQIPSRSFVAPYSVGGHKLPAIFDPLDDATAASFLGSVDAPVGVMRIARRLPDLSLPLADGLVYRQCESDSSRPCVVDADCETGLCAVAATCHNAAQVDLGLTCQNDSDCGLDQECGPALFDFSDRLSCDTGALPCAASDRVGPVLITNSEFSTEARDAVPLAGLIETPNLFAFVQSEEIATPKDVICPGTAGQDLNGDGDCTDSVLVLRDRMTGQLHPTGALASAGLATVRVRQPPFGFPAVAVEDDIAAFLVSEPLQGEGDLNGDLDVADTLLRIFRVDATGATDHMELNPTSLCADAAPVLAGQSVVVSDGLVFFRYSEVACAQKATRVVSGLSPTPPPTFVTGLSGGFSADGTLALFASTDVDAAPGKTATTLDWFVRDLAQPTIEWVSFGTEGGTPPQQADADVEFTSLSADGNWVVYSTIATNIDPAAPDNGFQKAYLYDRTATSPAPAYLDVSTTGAPADADVFAGLLSHDGTIVLFLSVAQNLIQNQGGAGQLHAYVHDVSQGLTEMIDVNDLGEAGDFSVAPDAFIAMSLDGRYVVFRSSATNLVDGSVFSPGRRIYIRDRTEQTTRLVNLSRTGGLDDVLAGVSANGRFVLLASASPDLVPGDTNDAWDWFVVDVEQGTTERVSVRSDGGEASGPAIGFFNSGDAISADGRIALFDSAHVNLADGDTNNVFDTFVHDRLTGITERVSLGDNGVPFSGQAKSGFLSADGHVFGFELRLEAPTSGPFTPVVRHANSGIDRNQDGKLSAFVLGVADARIPGNLIFVPRAVSQADIADGSVAFLVPNDLDGDSISDSSVVHLFRNRASQFFNLGLEATEVALASNWIAVLASEAQGGADLNSDGDMDDDVIAVNAVATATSLSWVNVGQAAERLDASGAYVAFLTSELAQPPGTDVTGDGVADDRYLQLYDASAAALVPMVTSGVLPVDNFVLGEEILAFGVREAALGPVACDLNGDGDCDDDVLHAFDLASRQLFNSGQAVNPCPVEACDARLPYNVFESQVTFATLESDQSEDLDGDGQINRLVLQTFNVAEAVAIGEPLADACVTPLAATSTGLCSDSGLACTNDVDCSSGGVCFLPPGTCVQNLGTTCQFNANGSGKASDCVTGFCRVETLTCHEVAVSPDPIRCASQTDCNPGFTCLDAAEDATRLVSPFLARADGTQVFSAASANGELILAGAADGDGDGIADPFDNCLLRANPDQFDTDANGVGDACQSNAAGFDLNIPGMTAQGGSVSLNVDGVMLAVTIVAGETAAQVAANIAAAVNADAALQGLGVSAFTVGSQISIDGLVTGLVIDDLGLAPPPPAAVPTLGLVPLVVCALLFLLVGGIASRRRA